MAQKKYVSDVPSLLKEWDYEKNYSISPDKTTYKSSRRVWWICSEGHKWEAVVSSRQRGNGCPYCSGRKKIPGINDLSTLYPDIARQWDRGKNKGDIPSDMSPSSHKKVWWICNKGHSYSTRVDNRVNLNRGCPYCSGRKPVSGKGDLLSVNPRLAQQWDCESNGDLSPQSISPYSNKKVWWICEKGHKWQATVGSRNQGSMCPYCSGRKPVAGENDLATVNPTIASQWDYLSNAPLSPCDVTQGSDISAWWVCDKGHRYKSVVGKRTGRGDGCPLCSNNVSKAETEIAEYIQSLLKDRYSILRSNRTVISPYELDIYIPDKNIAIEFNGLYWHTESKGKGRQYHFNKWRMCKDEGTQLITIWEDEWRDKQDIVKSMLAHKLGASQDKRVYARKTSLSYIDKDQAKRFFSLHHIQGAISSSVYIGLKDEDGNLSALSSWRKNRDVLYLDRYATSCIVVGGMGKILKEGIKYARDNGFSSIVTFSDHQVSDGGLYKRLGFIEDKELPPDYYYVVAGERKHKFGYRLKRFRNDPNLIYKEDLTEKELAQLNGLERIWDCGKTRWVIKI